MDRGTFPLLSEAEGTPCDCVLSPTFSGVDICANAHGIHWMIGAIFVKVSQLILKLILMKIIKIVATRC